MGNITKMYIILICVMNKIITCPASRVLWKKEKMSLLSAI